MARKKTVNIEELKAKYGDTKIMVCPCEEVKKYIPTGFSRIERTATIGNVRMSHFRVVLNQHLVPMLRAEAECDTNYKQPISYVIVKDKAGRIFTTKRIKGDARLVGLCSIGTGGHIDENEDLYAAMYRELREEIGLEEDNIFSYKYTGYILDETTQVNSVHLGIYVELIVDDPSKVAVKETEKLEGFWLTKEEVLKLAKEDSLESWSKIYVEGGAL